MPIQAPQLDDLRYERIVEELTRRIPVHTPEWTDYNDSDPGITLIQLFAHLADLIGYRLNRVPEKNHIELLKLLGIRLKPARPARTLLALLLADPTTLRGFTLLQGARAKATVGTPPPSFETEADLDIVPAQPLTLITTASDKLWSLGTLSAGEDPPEDPSVNRFLTVVWDGQKPRLMEMPLEPPVLFPEPGQHYLWVGLAYNPALDGGFLGVQVTLTIQLDDDEQPDLAGAHRCERRRPQGEAPPRVDWLHYFDARARTMRLIPGRIDDNTEHLARSGSLRFTIPFSLGSIPEDMFENLRDAVEPSPLQGCQRLAQTLQDQVMAMDNGNIDLTQLQNALTSAVSDIQAQAIQEVSEEPHPLDSRLRDPDRVRGWLRLSLPAPLPTGWTSPRLRIITFNATAASNTTTVNSELLGNTSGRPGQQFRLAHGNVQGEMDLAIQGNPNQPPVTWKQVDSLDGAGPDDRVFALDRESGEIQFGDGIRGRIPPLSPGGGSVVVRRYRYGGGRSGEVGVATITALESPQAGLAGCVNIVAARGGADPETLEDAKERVRKEMSTRSRAVTQGDFEFIAKQTPGVRVGRVVVVPLARPIPGNLPLTPLAEVRCAGPLPHRPAGLDTRLLAHGAVTVIAVPDEAGVEPTPSPSFLRAVCDHLNRHRLVTTEIYVVSPQYARLCNLRVQVRAQPGYTRTRLQTLVEERLSTYLHVLKGGEDGQGFPFGAQVHVADLIAQVFRTEGVERVEQLTAEFTRTKTNSDPRQGELTLCPTWAGQFARIDLAPEETVSLDGTTLTLSTVA